MFDPDRDFANEASCPSEADLEDIEREAPEDDSEVEDLAEDVMGVPDGFGEVYPEPDFTREEDPFYGDETPLGEQLDGGFEE